MPSRAGTHPTRLWGRYENGRRKYVSQKERQKNETGRKKIRRDAQGRDEGLVSGVGAKMFIIAGPVIVYGMLASVVWGVIYHFIRPLMGG